MLRFSALILVLAIGLASGNSNSSSPISPSPTISSHTPTSSSAEHSSTSAEPSSSPSASISPSPTSMTSSPSASPTPKPTTKPTTKPPPKDGDYSVKDKDGKYCLLAMLDVSCMVEYENTKTNKTSKVMIHMPIKNSMFNKNGSECGPKPVLRVSWPKAKPFYHFEMKFKSTKGKGASNTSEWKVSEMSLMVKTEDNPRFPNSTETEITVSVTNSTELGGLNASTEGYYTCAANRTYPSKNGKLFLSYVKLQPFGVKPSNTTELFGKEFNCEAPAPTPAKKDDNNIVPIAVGCALAGLVLIVLIAYIIGRRKSQRGYEKV